MRQLSLRGRLLALVALTALASAAIAGPRPELDVTQGMRAPDATRSRATRAVADPALQALGRATSYDDRFNVPTMLWADRSKLGRGFAAGSARPNIETVARRYLGQVSGLYRLQAADVAAASMRAVHDIGTGGIIATFGQDIDGIPVFRDEVKVLMARDLSLIAISGYIPSQSLVANAAAQSFALTPEAAIATAFSDFTGRTTSAGSVRAEGAPGEGGYQYFDASAAAAGLEDGLRPGGPVRARKTWFHTPDALLPAYYMEFMAPDQAYSYVVDANTGELLFRHDLMASDIFNYRVWAEAAAPHRPYDGPQGNGPTPHPTGLPDFYAPTFQAPVLKSLQNGPISTNDPWLAPGASVTTGNNVDAYADLVSPDGFSAGDLRATSTSANTFDRTYDVNQAPTVSNDQRMAAITQLFYNNNFFHDWYYDSGFDEASGNGQTNNFGRGGLGNDAMRSEAQDFGGTNNANMSTPADGSPGRMQMYLFTPAGAASVTVPSGPAAGTYPVGVATGFGPQSFNVTGQLIVGVDGIAPTNDGCSGLSNAAAVAGKIVLIDRGTCSFLIKVQNAAGAGAIGCIIVDNVASATPPGMGGTGTTTIPSVSVTLAVGNALKAAIAGGTTTATLLRAASIGRDGSLDNQIVAHEWGHFISNRLVGNAAGLSTNMAGGLGEGWADFHAMLMSVRPEDLLQPANANWNGVYGLAGYALYPSVGASNAFYYGIRRVPYSTDLTKNGLTFKHIENNIALPAGVPTAFGQTGSNNAEVHNTGEVWCTMLWECYAALLNDNVRLTFDQAQARMKQYIVAGYKLTPNAPTLLEARDAILAAAFANDVADYQLMWAAFAKRGAGVGAVAPNRFSQTNSSVTESFVTGGELSLIGTAISVDTYDCDADIWLDENEVGHATIEVFNSGSTSLTGLSATVSSPDPFISFPEGTTVTLPTLPPFGSTSVIVKVAMSGAVGAQDFSVNAVITGNGFATPGSRSFTLYDHGNVDEVPSSTETVEAFNITWTFAGTPGTEGLFELAKFPGQAGHYFAGPDVGQTADNTLTSPPLLVGTDPVTLSFKHTYDFERDATSFYDGGVVELSNNGGATWTDIGTSLVPGYSSTLYSGAGQSPLGGRGAYAGQAAGYPSSLSTVTANLGTTYAGQTILIRFRIGCDIGVGAGGWIIDDIQLTGLQTQPFFGLGPDAAPCAPVSVDPGAPRDLALAVAGPNPARGGSVLRFGLPSAQQAEVHVYDIVGRRVATLASGTREAGWHQVAWHQNDDGRTPGAGVYFARLVTGSGTLTKRVVVLQ